MWLLIERDACERSDEPAAATMRLCPECAREVRKVRVTSSESRVSLSEIESLKASGDAIDASIVQSIDVIRYVGDRTTTWHDTETTGLLEPSMSPNNLLL